MIRFSTEQTLLIHSYLIEVSGGTEGLRDEAALESALRAPFQTFGGEDLYPGKLRKAAALCFGLIQNHPFVDGNKRIGTPSNLLHNHYKLNQPYTPKPLDSCIFMQLSRPQTLFRYIPS